MRGETAGAVARTIRPGLGACSARVVERRRGRRRGIGRRRAGAPAGGARAAGPRAAVGDRRRDGPAAGGGVPAGCARPVGERGLAGARRRARARRACARQARPRRAAARGSAIGTSGSGAAAARWKTSPSDAAEDPLAPGDALSSDTSRGEHPALAAEHRGLGLHAARHDDVGALGRRGRRHLLRRAPPAPAAQRTFQARSSRIERYVYSRSARARHGRFAHRRASPPAPRRGTSRRRLRRRRS